MGSPDAVLSPRVSARAEHPIHVVLAGRGRWQRPAFTLVQLDGLFHEFAQLGEHFPFVGTVTAPVEQAGATADEALVFVGPFDDLRVTGGLFHLLDSSITSLTAAHQVSQQARPYNAAGKCHLF
jgi:hypothetical protein